MNMRANDRLVQLVDAAFGELPLADLGPLSKAESTRLGQLQATVKGIQEKSYSAPESLVRTAKACFEGRAMLEMRIASTSLQPSGARAAVAEVVHVAYERGENHVRAMYVREPNGWRVIGQAPSGVWTIVCDDEVFVSDSDGRFELSAVGSSPPGLLLVRGKIRLLLAPPGASQ